MTTFLAALCLAAGLAAAVLETRDRPVASALSKMAAATAYIVFALRLGATGTVYGRVVLVALALSWLGDLALTRKGAGRWFAAGLGAFLAAHLAYGAAFLVRGVALHGTLAGAVVMAVVAVVVLRWIEGGTLPERLRIPVRAYLAAIGVMVALAAGTGSAAILAGATLFAVSDIFVARQRFVRPAAVNRMVGLPLYFAGQLLLAWSVA